MEHNNLGFILVHLEEDKKDYSRRNYCSFEDQLFMSSILWSKGYLQEGTYLLLILLTGLDLP